MDWDPKPFIDKLKRDVEGSYIVTFPNDEEKCSYVRLEKDRVVEVREKKVISNMATVGIYHWSKTSDFFIDAKKMIEDDVRDNNEYYVAPVYNYTIKRGLKVKIHNIKKGEFYPIGTPVDYKLFTANNKNFE
jgi:dTDP-glucose pyrophosphorylase